MKAVIMAGGLGSRLYPLTADCPKPMVPFVNKPVLAHILDLLKRHHFSEVIITVSYLAHQIQEYFGDGRHLGITIHYAQEDAPLGTAGSVKNAQPYLDNEPFLVISGDIVTDIDLSSLWRFHRQKDALATMALKPVANPSDYGVVVAGSGGRIKRYLEKPGPEQIISNTVNIGIYVFNPEILTWMEPGVAYDFSYDIFPSLLAQKQSFFAYQIDDYWRDMGTLSSYMQATADALTGKVRHIDLGYHRGDGIWTGSEVEIAPDAILQGPIYLGHKVKINKGAIIQGPTVVYDNTVVNNGARVDRAFIGPSCFVDEAVKMCGTITGQTRFYTAGSAALIENGLISTAGSSIQPPA